jgi:hypothetical protein
MTRFNKFPGNLINMSMVGMVAVAVTAGTMTGGWGGSYAAAAQPGPAMMATIPIPGPGPVLTPMPVRGPLVILVAYAGYELGRNAWAKHDGPRVLSKAYEATRQAAGAAVRYGKSTVATVSRAAVRVVDATTSKAAAIYHWLRE